MGDKQAKSENICSRLCCTKIENFGVSFGGAKIFDNVNVHIHCGELTAIIGKNGAGKSTLLKAILGEVKHSGELKYMDEKGVHTGNPCIGYVPQYLNFDVGTPTSVLDLFNSCLARMPSWLCCSQKMRKRVSDDLKKVKAEHLIDRRLGALSGGELQRVLLALAIDPIPDLLLLDEPLSALDAAHKAEIIPFFQKIKQNLDIPMLYVSHNKAEIEQLTDEIWYL